jgi:hypothetical protein
MTEVHTEVPNAVNARRMVAADGLNDGILLETWEPTYWAMVVEATKSVSKGRMKTMTTTDVLMDLKTMSALLAVPASRTGTGCGQGCDAETGLTNVACAAGIGAEYDGEQTLTAEEESLI